MSRPDLNLRQAALSFIALVVGVFVALAAEAWWQEREEASIERETLRLLAVELDAVDAELRRVMKVDSATESSLDGSLRRLRAGELGASAEFDLNLEDYRIRHGALARALAEPGPVLRGDAQLYATLSDLDAVIRNSEQLVFMLTSTTLDDLDSFFRAMATLGGTGDPEVRRRAIRSDPAVSAGLQIWLLALRNREVIHQRLRAAVEEARVEVDRVLDGGG